jgi:hypothetical protein
MGASILQHKGHACRGVNLPGLDASLSTVVVRFMSLLDGGGGCCGGLPFRHDGLLLLDPDPAVAGELIRCSLCNRGAPGDVLNIYHNEITNMKEPQSRE